MQCGAVLGVPEKAFLEISYLNRDLHESREQDVGYMSETSKGESLRQEDT